VPPSLRTVSYPEGLSPPKDIFHLRRRSCQSSATEFLRLSKYIACVDTSYILRFDGIGGVRFLTDEICSSYIFVLCSSQILLVLYIVNDPSAGSPTETLLRLLLPLNDQVWSSSR
jgi:hypothetical protein